MKNIKTSREMVVNALIDVENNGYSNIIINNYLNNVILIEREKDFATHLFYGVVERKITLEYLINKYVKKKLDSSVKAILMSGFYQLLFSDSIKDYTAVDESVKLCYIFKRRYSAGLVNAVLRNFIRDDKKIQYPKNEIDKLSIEYSCCKDIIEDLLTTYSKEDTIKVLEHFIKTPIIYATVNNKKIAQSDLINQFQEENIIANPTGVPNSIYFNNIKNIEKLQSFINGNFYIQDISSYLSVLNSLNNFSEKEKLNIIDLCSAPGGKSFAFAINTGEKSEIKSYDIYDFKIDLIDEGAKRLGINSIKASIFDATTENKSLINMADLVYCDVPCSGIGIAAKKPEIKYKTRKEYEDLPELQLKILENGSKYIKENGFLVYSTCTLLDSENNEVVKKFLKNNNNFEFVNTRLNILDKCIYNEKTGGTTILPKDFNSDGFYFSTLKRRY